MNSDLITHSLRKIGFINKYQSICSRFSDFDNRLKGKHKQLYDKVLNELGIQFHYEASEKFYKIKSAARDCSVELGLKLHEGLVECFMFFAQNGEWIFHGRFDFVAEQLDKNYDREKYNLPKYTSEEELELILREIFSIYEELKREVLKSEASLN